MSRFLILLSLLIPVAVASAATPLRFDNPGYVAIDGSYYVFGLPTIDGSLQPAQLHQLGDDGFLLQAFVSAAACIAGPGAPGATPPGSAHLVHSELIDVPLPLGLPLRGSTAQPARILFTVCDGTPVLIADTSSGTTSCSIGARPFPFRRGDCPALDANDAGHVFFDTFGRN